MKQLFLSMLIAATALTASAQKDYRNHDQSETYHYKNDRDTRYDLSKNYGPKDREMRRQIEAINREYNYKIVSIRHNQHMRDRVKDRKIRKLEIERRTAINDCQDRFTGRHRDYAERGRKR
jgi:hypothetical protein